jgi:hypothetical protein
MKRREIIAELLFATTQGAQTQQKRKVYSLATVSAGTALADTGC